MDDAVRLEHGAQARQRLQRGAGAAVFIMRELHLRAVRAGDGEGLDFLCMAAKVGHAAQA